MGKQASRLTQYLSEAISFPHRVLLPFSLHSVCVDKASQTWDSLTQWFQVETNAETIKALVALDEAGGGQGWSASPSASPSHSKDALELVLGDSGASNVM